LPLPEKQGVGSSILPLATIIMFSKIYDIGANKGQNIEYFLSVSKKVIAVEPINELCLQIEKNFQKSIKNNELTILNFAVVSDENTASFDFYLNRDKSWESSLIKNEKFKKVTVSATTLNKLFKQYGYPDCIKIDIEGYDFQVLKYMASSNILPDYLSIEIQNKKTLDFAINNFSYEYFNFVLGHRISEDYKHLNLKTHSSGPLGNDLKFKWVTKRLIKYYFIISRYGWIDLHCTNYKYNNENTIGIPKTLLYLLNDKIYRIFNPFKQKLVGKIKSVVSK
jgi:FkbM family methyltransferase